MTDQPSRELFSDDRSLTQLLGSNVITRYGILLPVFLLMCLFLAARDAWVTLGIGAALATFVWWLFG